MAHVTEKSRFKESRFRLELTPGSSESFYLNSISHSIDLSPKLAFSIVVITTEVMYSLIDIQKIIKNCL